MRVRHSFLSQANHHSPWKTSNAINLGFGQSPMSRRLLMLQSLPIPYVFAWIPCIRLRFCKHYVRIYHRSHLQSADRQSSPSNPERQTVNRIWWMSSCNVLPLFPKDLSPLYPSVNTAAIHPESAVTVSCTAELPCGMCRCFWQWQVP